MGTTATTTFHLEGPTRFSGGVLRKMRTVPAMDAAMPDSGPSDVAMVRVWGHAPGAPLVLLSADPELLRCLAAVCEELAYDLEAAQEEVAA